MSQLIKWANQDSSGTTEQILADCQAEIRKDEFHADYDRSTKSWMKLSSLNEEKFIVLLQETNNVDEINRFFMNNYWNKIGTFVKLMRWKNWSDFKDLQ